MLKKLIDWVVALFTPTKRPAIKMYVLVRTDMPPIHRAVQGMHAVAAYLINKENTLDAWTMDNNWRETWANGYLITLGVDNEEELAKWEKRLSVSGKKYSTFIEPDWADGPTKTALACISFGEEFTELPLLTMKDTHIQPEPVFEQIHTPRLIEQ